MFQRFLYLRKKEFLRNPQFVGNLLVTILMAVNYFFFSLMFLIAGIVLPMVITENSENNPFTQFGSTIETICAYLLFYFLFDLVLRYFFQKFNYLNIKPLLLTNIPKRKIVGQMLTQSMFSVYTLFSYLFFIPFFVVLLIHQPQKIAILSLAIACLLLAQVNNFINLFVNKNNTVFAIIVGILALGISANYFDLINILEVSRAIFYPFYQYPGLSLIFVPIVILLYRAAQKMILNNLYLDKGVIAQTEKVNNLNVSWLNRYGKIGTFLQLDVKMLTRNKRSKSTMLASFLFVFYGLLFFTGFSTFGDSGGMKMFAAIFVSGGFVFSFGNYIPSWDSAYYPLMMTQNVTYKDYLQAKWWLMVIATIACTLIGAFYIYFGWEIYLMVVSAAIFNIGVNSYLVMLSGAYIKTPIDLTTNKNLMGDKSAFNVRSLLLALPKMLVPMVLYGIGAILYTSWFGSLLVALAGIIGFAFKDYFFNQIQKVYQKEKYSTLQAYKRK